MVRYFVCSVALALIVWGLQSGLEASYKAWGMGTYAVLCLSLGFGSIAIGFAVDYAAGRWPKSRRLKQRDHQPWEP